MPARPQVRPWLSGARTYRPGRRIEDGDGRLASNEAPAPPTALVRDLSLASMQLNRYPDPSAAGLRRRIAERHGVDAEQVVVGNGSDELISLLVQGYAAYTGHVVVAHPGYSMYELCASRLRAQVTRVDLRDWRHDLREMARVEADIAFVCDPANPTGSVVPRDELEWFVENSAARMIVLDEAYAEFDTSRRADSLGWAVGSPRVVVLRTFSKAQALAGARVGYLVAHQEIADVVRSLRLPFSVNSVAQALAERALDHPGATDTAVRQLVEDRTRLQEVLDLHGFAYVPSQASFVLVLTPESDGLVAHMAEHGIAVRPGRDLGIRDAVRVTVPGPAGMDRLEDAFASFGKAALS